MFAAWLTRLMCIAPLAPKAPTARRALAVHGWVLRVLRGIFLWRVRFSLRSLLLLAAGLSAGIGARLRYDENPWQLTWRWSPPEDLAVERVELAPDGQRMAMLFEPTETLADERQPQTLLLFDRSGATPEVVYRPEVLDPLLFFDTQSRLRVADGHFLVDADSGKALIRWNDDEKLAGVSEDGRTATTSSIAVYDYDPKKPRCAVWDVECGTKRFELPAGHYWLTGPRCTPGGTIALALCCAPEFTAEAALPERKTAAFPPLQPSTRIAVWNLESGAVAQTFDHAEFVNAAVLSPDGRWLLAGGVNSLVLWDVADRRPVRRLRANGALKVASLGLDGTRAVLATSQAVSWGWWSGWPPTATTAKKIPLLDLFNDQAIAEIKAFENHPYDFGAYYLDEFWPEEYPARPDRMPAFTPDGARLVALNKESAPAVLDARSGEELCLLQHPQLIGRNCTEPPAVAAAAETVLLHDDRAVYRFERVRPEGDERILWIPEFWLAALFTAALSVSLLRDGKISPKSTQRPQRTARVG